jgi:Helicase C-terminal domain/Type III restriction enzyme, res subunit
MWSLYNNSEFLKPLKFSNGKTQEDVVNEVLDLIKQGTKVIFIRGMCGTGKSAIALNIAKDLGKTSIIVPGKNLQNQYKKDYENGKYLLKEDKERLKISVITGRNNHECAFIKDKEFSIPEIRREINSKLNDIFEFKREEIENKKRWDKSADNQDIPCKIEIKEKNWNKIIEYLKKNKNINLKNIEQISDIKRPPLASVCPYWSPVLPEIYDLKNLDCRNKRTYMGLDNTRFVIYQRKPGCSFYEQFNSYIDSDVIVFNSLKYKLESALKRKPVTEAEIVDECDEFLDSFTNQRNINIERLQSSLVKFAGTSEGSMEVIEDISNIIGYIKVNKQVNENLDTVIPLKKTGIYDLIRIFLDSEALVNELDEESYLFEIEETARMFEDFLDESYVIYSRKEGTLIASIVTTNLSKKFKEMLDKNKILILLSGTLHTEKIMREIFGLDDFKIIDAETQQPGKIDILRTGLEFDCRYENFKSGKFSRGDYLKALDKCVEIAKKPILIHVSAFTDLPSEFEIEDLNLKNLTSRENLKELQEEDKGGIMIDKFKNGDIDVLFTTKCARGVDFPGEQCNSIVFTKYPNPNPSEPFWKILNQTNPNQYWEFYKDKAKRDLLQKVYRGLRFKEDHVFLLSPDVRVLKEFE